MQILFLDDACQRNCTRKNVGKLVAVGGIIVDAQAARRLEQAINSICLDFRFPPGEPFKWSPGRDHWMRDNLVAERRESFFRKVLEAAAQHDALGQVTICDSSKRMATRKAKTHEMDVLVMALERFDWVLQRGDLGMVIASRPSGGRGDENEFLSKCVEIVTAGTEYTAFPKLVMNVLTMPFPNSRLLQIADLVVSITTAMVARHTEFAGAVFPSVKSLLRVSMGRVGGVGIKIHPDYCYANLYHWIFGDDTFWRFQNGWSLPLEGRPFSKSADIY
jgi:hypothetical protein